MKYADFLCSTGQACLFFVSDVSVVPWRDDPDENIGRVRDVTYTVPLNAPFGPKSSQTLEKQMCYKQSKPGILYVIDAECTPTGIPYADAFYVVNRYCLTRVSKGKSRLRVTSEVKYRKSVWGVVKSKSTMGRIMRKPAVCIGKQKPRSAVGYWAVD